MSAGSFPGCCCDSGSQIKEAAIYGGWNAFTSVNPDLDPEGTRLLWKRVRYKEEVLYGSGAGQWSQFEGYYDIAANFPVFLPNTYASTRENWEAAVAEIGSLFVTPGELTVEGPAIRRLTIYHPFTPDVVPIFQITWEVLDQLSSIPPPITAEMFSEAAALLNNFDFSQIADGHTALFSAMRDDIIFPSAAETVPPTMHEQNLLTNVASNAPFACALFCGPVMWDDNGQIPPQPNQLGLDPITWVLIRQQQIQFPAEGTIPYYNCSLGAVWVKSVNITCILTEVAPQMCFPDSEGICEEPANPVTRLFPVPTTASAVFVVLSDAPGKCIECL